MELKETGIILWWYDAPASQGDFTAWHSRRRPPNTNLYNDLVETVISSAG